MPGGPSGECVAHLGRAHQGLQEGNDEGDRREHQHLEHVAEENGYDHAQVGLGREFEESVIVPFRYTVIQCIEQDPRPFLL